MAARAWLATQPLGETPTAFTVGAQNVYVSYGRRIVRRPLDGADETPLFTALSDVSEMVALGGHVIIADGKGPDPLNRRRSIRDLPMGLHVATMAP